MRRDQILGFCAISALTVLVGTNITLVLVADRLSSGLARARQLLGLAVARRALRTA
jgi:hypothetical protein